MTVTVRSVDDTEIARTVSDEEGDFLLRFDVPEAIDLYFEKRGFLPTLAKRQSTGDRIHIEASLQPVDQQRVRGITRRAVSGSFLPGVKVAVRSGDRVEQELLSDENGQFSTTFTPGQNLQFSKSGFLPVTVLVADVSSVPQPLIVQMDELSDSDSWVTLTWGAKPRDLDLHVIGETANGRFHISYKNRGSLSSWPRIALDRDETNGFGKETVRFSSSGRLRFFVHNYSGDGDSFSCRVDGKVGEEDVSFSRDGFTGYWLLLDIDGGRLVERSSVSSSEPGF